MLRDLKVTLYDFFGYLLPGIVVVAAIWVFGWSLFFPRMPLGPLDLSGDMHLLLGVAAYFLGHVAQALGNVIARLFSRQPEQEVLKRHVPAELVELARKRAGTMLGTNLKHLDAEWLVKVCDEALVACGTSGEREVFQYREGFYRGLSVSFGLLGVAVFTRGTAPGSTVVLGGDIQPVARVAWLLLCITLALCTWLIWRRFVRFRRYRIQHAIAGYLVTHAGAVGQQHIETGDVSVTSLTGEEG